MSILLKNVTHNGTQTDILIKGGLFKSLAAGADCAAGRVLDCSGKAILPGFYNAHTHAPMSLLRGYADDLELFEWLSKHIWPVEARLTEQDIRAGARLAMLEMIKTGTVFFADMYWRFSAAIEEAAAIGLRSCVGPLLLDAFDSSLTERQIADCEELISMLADLSPLITPALMPHSVYGVRRETLEYVAQKSAEHDLIVHIHLSETAKEVSDCIAQTGLRPAEYLDSLGLLTPRTIVAHAIHITPAEAELLIERGARIAHIPVSNMKLCSGFFPSKLFEHHQHLLTLGTDGCSSNNNLCMTEEMKFAALLAKHGHNHAAFFAAHDVFKMATVNGAAAYGLCAGKIEEGALADCILVDLDNPMLVPGYDIISDMVYSADSSCIDTVICAGKLLMENRKVPGEADIIAEAREAKSRILVGARFIAP